MVPKSNGIVIPKKAIGKRYLGIDPGIAAMGLAVIEVTEKGLEIIDIQEEGSSSKEAIGARLNALMKHILFLIDTHGVSGIACEGPSFKSQTAPYSLGAVHGLVNIIADMRGIPIIKVAPLQLIKFCHLPPSKQTVMLSLKEKTRLGLLAYFGYDFNEVTATDPVDAAGLATVAAFYFGGITANSRAKMEIVNKVKPYHNFN